jgi:hypothetical protein
MWACFSLNQVSQVLGIGYWAKAVLLPLGFVFLIAAMCEPVVWRVRRRLLLSAAAFVLVAAPLVVASLDRKCAGRKMWGRSAAFRGRDIFDKETRRKALAFAADAVYGRRILLWWSGRVDRTPLTMEKLWRDCGDSPVLPRKFASNTLRKCL